MWDMERWMAGCVSCHSRDCPRTVKSGTAFRDDELLAMISPGEWALGRAGAGWPSRVLDERSILARGPSGGGTDGLATVGREREHRCRLLSFFGVESGGPRRPAPGPRDRSNVSARIHVENATHTAFDVPRRSGGAAISCPTASPLIMKVQNPESSTCRDSEKFSREIPDFDAIAMVAVSCNDPMSSADRDEGRTGYTEPEGEVRPVRHGVAAVFRRPAVGNGALLGSSRHATPGAVPPSAPADPNRVTTCNTPRQKNRRTTPRHCPSCHRSPRRSAASGRPG